MHDSLSDLKHDYENLQNYHQMLRNKYAHALQTIEDLQNEIKVKVYGEENKNKLDEDKNSALYRKCDILENLVRQRDQPFWKQKSLLMQPRK